MPGTGVLVAHPSTAAAQAISKSNRHGKQVVLPLEECDPAD